MIEISANPGTIQASATVLSQVILPSQGNFAGTAHGGELLKMMDDCAAVCAGKHARSLVMTAGIDHVVFHAPVMIGNQATCRANITYSSKRSLEVAVSITAEDIYTGESECCMTAYFTLCSINEHLEVQEMPPIILEADNERKIFEEGRQRAEIRKQQPQVCWLPLY